MPLSSHSTETHACLGTVPCVGTARRFQHTCGTFKPCESVLISTSTQHIHNNNWADPITAGRNHQHRPTSSSSPSSSLQKHISSLTFGPEAALFPVRTQSAQNRRLELEHHHPRQPSAEKRNTRHVAQDLFWMWMWGVKGSSAHCDVFDFCPCAASVISEQPWQRRGALWDT